ncbi:MAG TPA: hypothetical protein VFJ86_11040 [Usitatibacter sp.]|jgi:hypothetical protein|nr:hypothetical protein [Usitatibacter sp.]
MLALRSFLAAIVLIVAPALAHAAMLPGIGDLERSLHLDARQKAQFDVAVEATHRALASVGFAALQVKASIAAQLGKEHPDLGAIARAQEDAIERTRPLFREARREWERLYAMLDPRQVRKARAYVDAKLDGLERLGAALGEMLGESFKR